jgi:CPA2 family monovalent cation:H+ antiporter-2
LKRYILVGGLLQVGLSIALIWVLSLFFGFTFLQSGLIGIALTSSSTAVVAKIIQDRGESDSFIGEVTLGILMFQDLAFIPFIIIFSSLNGADFSFGQTLLSILGSMLKTALIIAAMYYAGKRFIPTLFHRIARSSRELLNLFVLAFIFLIISLSELIHVPVLIGAFIAGILVSETVEHYDIFIQVRPLRDVMAIIFFVYVGSQIRVVEVVGSHFPHIFFFHAGEEFTCEWTTFPEALQPFDIITQVLLLAPCQVTNQGLVPTNFFYAKHFFGHKPTTQAVAFVSRQASWHRGFLDLRKRRT